MGVESATYVNDFDTSLPSSTDLRSQGDDHLRLLKSVLKNTFTRATRSLSVPGTLSKTANYTVVKDDQEHTIYVNTAAGACTMTLPTLVAGDAGWKVHFIKTNSGPNAMFISPPSGTINSGGISGLSTCRRAIPGVRITAVWDGTGFFVTRALALPIGSVINCNQTGLPAGFEWPNGQTLASAASNYPEYNNVFGSGVTLDYRGMVAAGRDDMGGSARSKLTSATITGGATTVGNISAATETKALTTANLPAYTPAGTISNSLTSALTGHTDSSGFQSGTGAIGITTSGGTLPGTVSGTSTFTGTAQGGTSTPFSIVQPTIICNKLLIVE